MGGNLCYDTCDVLVAQLDRALDSDSKGQRFKSSRARQIGAKFALFRFSFLKEVVRPLPCSSFSAKKHVLASCAFGRSCAQRIDSVSEIERRSKPSPALLPLLSLANLCLAALLKILDFAIPTPQAMPARFFMFPRPSLSAKHIFFDPHIL